MTLVIRGERGEALRASSSSEGDRATKSRMTYWSDSEQTNSFSEIRLPQILHRGLHEVRIRIAQDRVNRRLRSRIALRCDPGFAPRHPCHPRPQSSRRRRATRRRHWRQFPAADSSRTFRTTREKIPCGVRRPRKEPRRRSGCVCLPCIARCLPAATPGSAARFLSDETVRQFVLEDARQLIGHAGQALHRDANAAVIERSDPTGRARDVHECLIGVQNHADGFGRYVVQSGRDFLELGFERLEERRAPVPARRLRYKRRRKCVVSPSR